LFDRRRGKPSPKKVPLAVVVEKVLGVYREKYFDLNVRHFHEKLREEHQVGISYSWVRGKQGRSVGAFRVPSISYSRACCMLVFSVYGESCLRKGSGL